MARLAFIQSLGRIIVALFIVARPICRVRIIFKAVPSLALSLL